MTDNEKIARWAGLAEAARIAMNRFIKGYPDKAESHALKCDIAAAIGRG